MSNKLTDLIGKALSFEDIQTIMINATGKRIHIIQLNEACKAKQTINQILNENNKVAVLFMPILSPYNGHYVVLNFCLWTFTAVPFLFQSCWCKD